MRKARIKFKGENSGELIQEDDGTFIFKYDDAWFKDVQKPAISLTLPKSKQIYQSVFLFPFFYHMLPEGTNKQIICKLSRIDHDDYFSLLMETARFDSIGAVTVEKI